MVLRCNVSRFFVLLQVMKERVLEWGSGCVVKFLFTRVTRMLLFDQKKYPSILGGWKILRITGRGHCAILYIKYIW